ncbi:MAG: hypothetical protein M3Y31_06475 [Gemmatimonadota bacterium]|nr:hypothetical protein [Gemmatimonadota bacterium]
MRRLTRAGWWLGLLMVGTGITVTAQSEPPPPRAELKENQPNPFVTSTTIPFEIASEVCSGGHRPEVSLKVYNVLVQVVAVPVLIGDGDRLDNARLGCGSHQAYWDGMYLDGQRAATAGIYYYQLTVDGERYTRKMRKTTNP